MTQILRYKHHSAEVAGGDEIAASAVGTAGAQLIVSLPARAGFYLYLAYIVVTTGPVVAVVSGTVEIDGLVGGPYYGILTETVSAGGYLPFVFRPPMPSTTINAPVTVTVPVIGGGGVPAVLMTGWYNT